MPVDDRSLRLVVLEPEAEAPASHQVKLVGTFYGEDFGRFFQRFQRVLLL